jgi:hypothetical protein
MMHALRAYWQRWRDRRRFLATVRAAMRADGAMVILSYERKLKRENAITAWRVEVGSYAQGTPARHRDRALVKAFDTEYRRFSREGA